jgi:hypothetical protein
LPTIRQLTRPSTLPLLEVIHPLRENRLYQPTGESIKCQQNSRRDAGRQSIKDLLAYFSSFELQFELKKKKSFFGDRLFVDVERTKSFSSPRPAIYSWPFFAPMDKGV